ncbi:unnamed protein product [Arabidopsis halleri]
MFGSDPPKNLDPVTKHAAPIPSKYGSWTCIYCKKVTNGGVQRAKQHIVGGFRNVTQCYLVPPNVREEIKDFMLKNVEIKATTQMMPPPGTSYDDYDYEEEEEVEVLASKKGKPPVKKHKGPMDRVPLLKKEVNATEKKLVEHKAEWATRGCSIMSDGWRDSVLQKDIVNFLVNSPKGSVFIKSVDVSTVVKDANMLFDHMDRMVEEVAEANVVQVITNNASNYVKAGELLMAKRSHLYWTPCAAHCIDLILEDIGKIPQGKTVIKKCIFMNGYIYGHSFLVNMMRKFTNQGNQHRLAVTRFATSFITLAQYYRKRKNLRDFVNSQDWLVDGEKKPAMGYIYEAMDRAKDSIVGTFKGREEKYKEAFEIIDRRWNCQLHHPLHAPGYYLNLEFQYKEGAGVDCEEDKESSDEYRELVFDDSDFTWEMVSKVSGANEPNYLTRAKRGSAQSSSRTAKGKNIATCSTPTPRASQRTAPTLMALIDEDNEIEEDFVGGDEDNEIEEDFVGDDNDEADF